MILNSKYQTTDMNTPSHLYLFRREIEWASKGSIRYRVTVYLHGTRDVTLALTNPTNRVRFSAPEFLFRIIAFS